MRYVPTNRRAAVQHTRYNNNIMHAFVCISNICATMRSSKTVKTILIDDYARAPLLYDIMQTLQMENAKSINLYYGENRIGKMLIFNWIHDLFVSF